MRDSAKTAAAETRSEVFSLISEPQTQLSDYVAHSIGCRRRQPELRVSRGSGDWRGDVHNIARICDVVDGVGGVDLELQTVAVFQAEHASQRSVEREVQGAGDDVAPGIA